MSSCTSNQKYKYLPPFCAYPNALCIMYKDRRLVAHVFAVMKPM